MASIVPVPLLLNDCTLKIATDNYEASVNEVTMTPTVPVSTFQGMTPEAVLPVAGAPAWAVQFGYAQDHESANSMSEYLRLNSGQRKPVEFQPKKGGATFKVDVLIVAGVIGGQGNNLATGTVQLQCFGQPVRTPAAGA